MILYCDVERHRAAIAKDIKPALVGLEEHIIDKRDNGQIPPCTSKWRIKSTDSIYLKTKIKKYKLVDDLKKITDYGGIRFLVLFEEDLHSVHRELLEYLSEKRLLLREFKLFNWDDKAREKRFYNEIVRFFDDELDVRDNKDGDVVWPESGYRSIHYLVEKKDSFCIEIQLRTYLQDVWGELEHSLVYKNGTINPFVSQSFVRLAKELAIQDANVQHLYGISKKEVAFNKTVRKYDILPAYLTHNSSLLDQETVGSDEYKKYVLHASSRPQRNYRDEWVRCGRDMLEVLLKKVKGEHTCITLWKTTEEAYWMFQNAELELGRDKCRLAEELRKDIRPDWGYSINMRIGESYSAEGNIAKALVEFDKSESMIKPHSIAGDAVSVYRLKMVMAYHYWVFGPKMYDIALLKIKEAKDIYEQYKSEFDADELVEIDSAIKNNVCWYLLEVCIRDYKSLKSSVDSQRRSGDFMFLAKKGYVESDSFQKEKSELIGRLESLISALHALAVGVDGAAPSNSYDTISWSYYNLYLILSDGLVSFADLSRSKESKKLLEELGMPVQEDKKKNCVVDTVLKLAEKYAQKMMKESKNAAVQLENSLLLQHVHLQEIFNGVNEKKNL